MLGPWRDDEAAAFRAVLAAFEAEHGVRTEYVGNPEVAGGLLAEMEAGTPPDVVVLPKPNWLQELASAGAIPPLGDDAAEAVRAHYGPTWIELAGDGDALYGVPFRANSKSLLWYRPDAVGDGQPETLDELEALAGRIADRGELSPFSVSGAPCCRWLLTDWFETVLLAEAGRDTYEALAAHDIPWTDPRVRRAARRYTSLLRTEWVLGGTDGVQAFGLAESFVNAFDDVPPGAALWLAQGSVFEALTDEADGPQPREEIAVMNFPTQGAVVGTVDTAVPLNTRDETMALLAYLATPEAPEPWIAAGGFISPNQDVPLSAYPNEFARHEAAQLIDARTFAYDLSDRVPQLLNEELQDGLLEMIVHPDEVDQILSRLEEVASREQGFR